MSTSDPGGRGSSARRAARGGQAPAGSSRATGNGSAAPSSSDRSGSRAVRQQLDPDALAALEDERDFLLRSLDDLEREHDAGDVDDGDYAELKDDYTARAAHVLRAIEDRGALASSVAPRRSWTRTAGALVVVAVLALGVGWFVFRDSGTRAPGQGLSGDARQDSANLVLQAQAATQQAQNELEAGDSQAAADQYRNALAAYDQALEISPTNVEAMTYRAWLLHIVASGSPTGDAAQLEAEARRGLDQAVATDATFADARVFRASVLNGLGDHAAAQADLDALDTSQIPAFMTTLVDNLRSEVAAGLAGGTPTTTAP